MTPCIEWTRARTGDGYGQVYRNGKVLYAHRVAWEDAHGPIPKGMLICHRCDNPPCVNVEHLFLGTYADNMADAIAKGRAAGPPHYRGDRNPAARLTAEQVAAIRADQRILRVVAADYGVHLSTIQRIRKGHNWVAA